MVDIDKVHKQERYLDKSGKRDWIDKYAHEYGEAKFDGAMAFTIGKYYQRIGKKDPEEMELAKIEDYKHRWIGELVNRYGNDREFAVRFVEDEIERARKLANDL